MSDVDADFEAAKAAAQAAASAVTEAAASDDADPGKCPTCGQPLGGMTAAANSGSELALLQAIRDRLLAAIETCPMRDLSPLTRRLQDVMKEIRELQERLSKESGGKKVGESDGDKSAGGNWDPSQDL